MTCTQQVIGVLTLHRHLLEEVSTGLLKLPVAVKLEVVSRTTLQTSVARPLYGVVKVKTLAVRYATNLCAGLAGLQVCTGRLKWKFDRLGVDLHVQSGCWTCYPYTWTCRWTCTR